MRDTSRLLAAITLGPGDSTLQANLATRGLPLRKRQRWIVLVAFWLFLCTPAFAVPAYAEAIPHATHISPTGLDSNRGTAGEPLRTLTEARDRVRSRPDRSTPVTVVLEAGRYELQESFHLGMADSGTPDAAVTYRAAPDAEVILSGARPVPETSVTAVSDSSVAARLNQEIADRVRQIDVASLGIAHTPGRQPEVTGADRPTGVHLIQGGVRSHEARYPNKGRHLRIAAVQADGQTPVWRIDDERPFTWSEVNDLWVAGFPGFDWGYQVQEVIQIDTQASTIALGTPSEFGSKAGQPFYFTHILEELDNVEEFYLDHKTGLLYFLPTGEDLYLSTLAEPLISGSSVSHVRFEGITFDGSRGEAIRMDGGKDIQIRDNTFTNLGLKAVRLTRMYDSVVDGNLIHDVGAGGISLTGGDRTTLTAGRNRAANNRISKFADTYPRYSPAIALDGVGNLALNNEIHTSPHVAIQVRGNDHVIDSNYIHDVALEASDSGAIYGGRDWTERGNVISNNYLARIGRGPDDVAAIYLDDMMSGTLVRSNIVVDSAVGVQHNGRDNEISSNIFVRTRRAVYVGDWSRSIAGPNGELEKRLNAVPYRSAAWRRYPHLADILEDDPSAQKYNVIASNAIIGDGRISVEEVPRAAVQLRHNRVLPADGLVTGESLEHFHIPAESPVQGVPGLRLPEVRSIGPYGQRPSRPDAADGDTYRLVGLLLLTASIALSGAGAFAWHVAGRRRH